MLEWTVHVYELCDLFEASNNLKNLPPVAQRSTYPTVHRFLYFRQDISNAKLNT